ncbi:MAG: hypothetical protein HC933_07055 [Pleurocapsa sp. SU_196_0]|nr:hypothetical protein [Pleurocapsa sp. SU_196_0]
MSLGIIVSLVSLTLLTVVFSSAETVMLPATARWLTADGPRVFALLESGEVTRFEGSRLTVIARGWSPDAPISFAHGRLHGIDARGELQVLTGDGFASSLGAKLSLNAGCWRFQRE